MLHAIQDRAWVVQQCLQAVAPDSTSQARLIELGLAETYQWARAEAETEGSATKRDVQKCDADQGYVPGIAVCDTGAAEQQNEYLQLKRSCTSGPELEQPATDEHPESNEYRRSGDRSTATCRWRLDRLNLLGHMARLQTHLDIQEG